METAKVSEARQRGAQEAQQPQQQGDTQVQAAFAQLLDMIIGNTKLAGTETETLQLASTAASKAQAPERVKAEPVTKEPKVSSDSTEKRSEDEPEEYTASAKAEPQQVTAPEAQSVQTKQVERAADAGAEQEGARSAAATPQQATEAADPAVTELVANAQEQVKTGLQAQNAAAQVAGEAKKAAAEGEPEVLPPTTQQPVAVAQESGEPVDAAAKAPVAKAAGKPTEAVVQEQTKDTDSMTEQSFSEFELQSGSEVKAPPVTAPSARNQRAGELIAEAFAFRPHGAPNGAEGLLQQAGGQRATQGVHGVGALLKAVDDKPTAEKARELGKSLTPAKQDAIVEKVKELLQTAAQNKSGNSFVVRLDPPELGNMTVKVTQKHGGLYARIVPESSEVETMLRNRIPELMQTLAANGINTENMQVSVGGERSETEMFQFNQFFNNSGEQREGKSARSSDLPPEATPVVEQGARAAAQSVPGWVA